MMDTLSLFFIGQLWAERGTVSANACIWEHEGTLNSFVTLDDGPGLHEPSTKYGVHQCLPRKRGPSSGYILRKEPSS